LHSLGDQIANDIRIAARFDCPVLITGGRPDERVTVAKLIHRREHFVSINCRDMTESVLVGEPAYGKKMTLFLDGIEEMSERVQAKLAEYLAEQVLVRARRGGRVIAAAGRPLMDKIAAKQFRVDLFYRLNLIHIDLAHRSDDLALVPDLGVGGCVQ
jgi:two-component system, NtrC family, response regulator